MPGGREEVSRLGEAFDRMPQALQDRDAKLQRAADEALYEAKKAGRNRMLASTAAAA